MKKTDHSEKISELLYSGRPTDNINSYVKSAIRKTEIWWACIVIIAVASTYCFAGKRKPSRQEILKAARPVVDSMQQEYQCKLDSIVEYQEYINKVIQ